MNESSSQNRYKDPHIDLKERDVGIRLIHREGYPVFGLVEFNLWGSCNRRCSFCPVSYPEIFTNKKEGIVFEDYLKVLNDLRAIEYKGVILWSMFSEPMLHKEIYELARATKDILPKLSLQMTSNGDSFRRRGDKLAALFDAGVDRVNLSLYDGPEQITLFKTIMERYKLSFDQVKLRRRYQESGNYGITISNRTGLIDSNQFRDENELAIIDLPLNKSCYYPFYQVAIDYDGDVLLCPHDWSRKYIAGNAFRENIWDLWKGPKFSNARKLLANNCRSIKSCISCDVSGDFIGKQNFDAFAAMKNK